MKLKIVQLNSVKRSVSNVSLEWKTSMVEFVPNNVAGYKLTPSQTHHNSTSGFRSHLNKVDSNKVPEHAHFYFSPIMHSSGHPNQFAAFPYGAKYFKNSCCPCVIYECNKFNLKVCKFGLFIRNQNLSDLQKVKFLISMTRLILND